MSEILTNAETTETESLTCEYCNQVIPRRQDAQVVYHCGQPTEHVVCNDCVDGDDYYRCDYCENVFNNDDDEMVTAFDWRHEPVYLCPECADQQTTECECCGERFLGSAIREDDAGTCVCEDCYEENYCTCYQCGNIIRNEDSYEYDGEYYCESCYEEVNRPELIRGYHSRPSTVFHHISEDVAQDPAYSGWDATQQTPYYGVELEMDDGNPDDGSEALYELTENETLAYMNHDGSLNEEGIEFITMPCTLRYHLTEFPWNKVSSTALRYGYRSHDASSSCGLHVHVDRQAFGRNRNDQERTLAKVIILVDRFWDKMVRFSRRNMYNLNRWAKKPCMEATSNDSDDQIREKFDKYNGSYDRYRAVNLQNDKTVEFRLFKGTLKVNTIKATLEFLDNLIKFSNNHDLKTIQMCEFSDICDYVKYPELQQYLSERHLLEVPAEELTTTDSTGEEDETTEEVYEDEDMDEEAEEEAIFTLP